MSLPRICQKQLYWDAELLLFSYSPHITFRELHWVVQGYTNWGRTMTFLPSPPFSNTLQSNTLQSSYVVMIASINVNFFDDFPLRCSQDVHLPLFSSWALAVISSDIFTDGKISQLLRLWIKVSNASISSGSQHASCFSCLPHAYHLTFNAFILLYLAALSLSHSVSDVAWIAILDGYLTNLTRRLCGEFSSNICQKLIQG